jgi:hypothetical protein
MIWPKDAFYLETEKCEVLDLDRKKAGSMSACQRSEKKCGITWAKVEMDRTKDTTLLGIDSRGCMAQVLVLAFGLFRLLWLALVFGNFRF